MRHWPPPVYTYGPTTYIHQTSAGDVIIATGGGSVGIGVDPTYARIEVDGGTLGSTAGNTLYPFSMQWNNGTNLSYFSVYAYRLSNGSSSATESVFVQFIPGGNYEAYFGFYPSSVSIGAYAYDTLGVSTTGTVSSDDGATLQLVPDGSAVLEARSTTRGFLLPRMTSSQKTSISSPVDGLMVYDSDRDTVATRENGEWADNVRTRFTATADKTVANTTSQTTLFGSGVGNLTLPAGFFIAGRSVRVRMVGYVEDTGSPTMRVRLKLGSSAVADTGAVTITALNQRPFRVEGLLTCRSTGGTGTAIGQVYFDSYDALSNGYSLTTATTTIDTTASLTLDVTLEWGTANVANTCTITNATVEVIN